MLPMCTIFCHALKILTAIILLIAINSLTLNSTALKNLPKNFQNCKFFHLAWANPSPNFCEIRVLYATNLSMQRVKIWCNLVHKLQICWHKTAMGHFPPNFWSALAPKLLVGHKKSRSAQKWYTCSIHMPSLVAICRRMAATEEK